MQPMATDDERSEWKKLSTYGSDVIIRNAARRIFDGSMHEYSQAR